MFKYIFKRLLIFIPTLIAVSLLTFVISANVPGDPIESMLTRNQGGEGQGSQRMATEKAYNTLRHELGFDLPVFYFTFTNATYSAVGKWSGTSPNYFVSLGNKNGTATAEGKLSGDQMAFGFEGRALVYRRLAD